MARIHTSGFEWNETTSAAVVDAVAAGSRICSVQNSVVRSGSLAGKCGASGSNGTGYFERNFTAAVSTSYFLRSYFCFANLPGSTVPIVWLGASSGVSAKLTSAGILQFFNDATGIQIGSDAATTIVADGTTWYRIELSVTLNGSTQITAAELRLDSVTVATVSGLTVAFTAAFEVGWNAAPGVSNVCYVDDIALNDSTGAAQNSWPGSGKVVLLKPISDSAGGTGWTLGTGTALGGNGFGAVDNTPPVGVADLTAGSDVKQIRNASSNANVNFDANLTTYTTAGVGASDTVNVLIPHVATGAPVVTSAKAGTFGISANPAITNVSLGAGGTAGAFWSGVAAGAYPTGWKWSFGTTTYAPSVTVGSSPVARITQVTASTRIAIVCAMGMYVDYTPAVVAAAPIPNVTMAPQRA